MTSKTDLPTTDIPVPPVHTDDESDGRAGGSHSSSSSSSSSGSFRLVLYLLGGLLLAISTITLPRGTEWLGAKALALEIVGIILAVLVISRGDWTWPRVRAALLAPPNVAILLFLAWVGISVARPDVHSMLKKFSYYEGMRYLGGALIYFGVVYGLSMRRHLERLIGLLIAAGSLGALMAFATYGERDLGSLAGAFRNAQFFAAFLTLLFPILLVASQTDEENWRRMAAQIATVLAAAGILVTQNRSSWFGTAVALLVLLALHLRFGVNDTKARFEKHKAVVPLAMVVLAVVLFFSLSQTASRIGWRVESLKKIEEDRTFRWRVGMWSKALRMTRDRPLMGWGVGQFPIQQALYFHPDTSNREQKAILKKRPGLGENAHNTYFQVMAETGLPGLALYLSILITFLVTAVRAIPQTRAGFRRGILMACIAAIAAQMVAAIGSPAWEFPECTLFFWLILGLGMAIAGVGDLGKTAPARVRVPEKRATKRV